MGRGRSRQSLRLQSEVSDPVSGSDGRPAVLDWLLNGTFCLFYSQLLVMEISSTPLHICLPPASYPASPLLCGSDDGLFYFSTQRSSSKARRYPATGSWFHWWVRKLLFKAELMFCFAPAQLSRLTD